MNWGFIESDFYNFAVLNTTFGILSAFASSILVEKEFPTAPLMTQVLQRLPWILGFNIVNLLGFDLANQHVPLSVVEDRTNKPWRPILDTTSR
jgi:hypothetical protein